MFLLLLTAASIVSLLLFVYFNRTKQDNGLLSVVFMSICFLFSWLAIVMWFTSLVEVWQIGLNTPGAYSHSLPIWSRVVLISLRAVVSWFPASRLALGILYALPFLLIPLASVAANPSRSKFSFATSTLFNVFFFWMQVIVDSQLLSSFMGLSIQGVILLLTYILFILALLLQQSFPLPKVLSS